MKRFDATDVGRTTRLAAVILAWNVFQHFYPYFDVVQADWPNELVSALRSAATDSDGEAFRQTLERLLVALHDGHGQVHWRGALPHPQAHLPLAWDWIEDQLVVTHVHSDVALSVEAGDVILTIDGLPAADVVRRTELRIPSATPQYRRYQALTRLLSGPRDSTVQLRIRRFRDASGLNLEIRRSTPLRVDEPRPSRLAELRPGIFYVDLARVDESDVRAALPSLERASGIVFDMRGYPSRVRWDLLGHLSDERLYSEHFGLPVPVFPDREALAFFPSRWSIAPRRPRLRARLAFLLDARAISQAEVWLGIVEHYRLAALVGSPSAGTNGNINPFTLPGDYRVTWTGLRVLKHDGSPHHGVGILPTISVQRTLAGVSRGRDEVLEAGLDSVRAPAPGN